MPSKATGKVGKAADKLNPKQIAFAVNYAVSGNATDAARRAGYSDKTAHAQGCRLLKHADVRALIVQEQADRWKRVQMSGDEVLARLAKLARVDVRKVFTAGGALKNPSELDDDTAFCVASVEAQLVFGDDGAPPEEIRKIKLRDPTPALRTLAQHLKLIGSDVNVNVSVDLADRLAKARKRAREGAGA